MRSNTTNQQNYDQKAERTGDKSTDQGLRLSNEAVVLVRRGERSELKGRNLF